jgi:hypothetical protein
LKSFPPEHKDFFEWERNAFKVLRNQKGMIQYLGDYSVERNGEWTYHILLEYGELDLDQFFADDHSYPPLLTLEIIEFWRSFFKVAEALGRLHDLKYTNADNIQKEYHG